MIDFIDNLIANSSSTTYLDSFTETNIENCTSFFESEYSTLLKYRWKINDYIIEKSFIINELDFNKSHNSYCFLLILEYLERFKLQESYHELFTICINKGLKLGSKHQAAKIFLLQINNRNDHYDKLEDVLNYLQYAYESEEDSDKNVLITFANYFSNVVRNVGQFNIEILIRVINKIVEQRNNYSFLGNKLIDQLLTIDYTDTLLADSLIQDLIERFSNRKLSISVSKNQLLIETGTLYSEYLANCHTSFSGIRQISVKEINLLSEVEKKRIHIDLKRGTKIIDSIIELSGYMVFYGLMHNEKLISAFNYLHKYIVNKRMRIIDWGCGQGLASLVLYDTINTNSLNSTITDITLIEPSEIALKRAVLHIKKYDELCKINVINKDLNSLSNIDFANSPIAKFHLFSNILDIELFSLSNLIKLVNESFKGENYFVCVSPYIGGDIKKGRLDTFMDSFKNNPHFEKIVSISEREGEWGNTKWTRLIRVFKVNI